MSTQRKLHEWEEIKNDFKDCLLLGNGSSMAVWDKFNYTSLFQEAKLKGIISEDAQKVFLEYGVEDFEQILAVIANATRVNQALSVSDTKTKAAYENIRDGLIKAVQVIHPLQNEVIEKLEKAAGFANQFDTIVSLNYDLILYWMILLANSKTLQTVYKDGFVGAGSTFPEDWRKVQESMSSRGERDVIMCYYPHGNLSLVTDQNNREIKIKADDGKLLLDTITDKWAEGFYVPLFISEGSSPQKLNSIRRSAYLSEMYYRVLPNEVGKTLVIYGSAVQQNDAHIFSALLTGKMSDIAVSMYQPKDFESESDDIEKMLKKYAVGKNINVKFFNAESAGAWVY